MRYLVSALLLSASLAQAAEVEISDGRVRAVPPTQDISAAFMTIHNSGSTPISLINAASAIAESVELHTNLNVDGKMQMRRIESMEIDANASLMLKPGGLHIMLIGLKQPLQMGAQVDFALEFSDGSIENIQLPVMQIQPMMKSMHQAHEPQQGHKAGQNNGMGHGHQN